MNEKERTLTLLRCCQCIGGAVGLISNCIGIYFTPIAESLQVGRGDVALMVTLTSLSTAFFAPVFVRLIRKFKISQVMSFGVLLGAASYLLMSVARSIFLFYVAGVLIGIAAGCFATLPVSLILKDWYGEKNGSKLGIAMGFSGVFAALMNPVLGKVITAFGYQTSFRLMAAMLVAVCLPCTLTMRLLHPEAVQAGTKKTTAGTASGIALSTLLMLCAAGICFSGQNGMNSNISALAVSTGYSLQFSATVASVQNLTNSLFKFVYGFVADRLGAIKASVMYLLIGLTGTALMTFMRSVPALMLGGAALYAANFSISTVGLSLLSQRAAKDNYADVYSKATICATSAYAVMTTFFGFLSDRTGSYQMSLFVVMLLAVSGILLVVLIGRKTKNVQA